MVVKMAEGLELVVKRENTKENNNIAGNIKYLFEGN